MPEPWAQGRLPKTHLHPHLRPSRGGRWAGGGGSGERGPDTWDSMRPQNGPGALPELELGLGNRPCTLQAWKVLLWPVACLCHSDSLALIDTHHPSESSSALDMELPGGGENIRASCFMALLTFTSLLPP